MAEKQPQSQTPDTVQAPVLAQAAPVPQRTPDPHDPDAIVNTVDGVQGDTPTKREQAKGYIEQLWAGNPHFACVNCQFDDFDEQRMKAHVNLAHPNR